MINVIVSPIITEKSMKDAAGGKYSFLVSRMASKTAIKQAVANMFKVSVINVFTIVNKGKRKRTGARRIETLASETKKATVRLRKGQTIGLFESGGGVQEEEKIEEKKKKN